MPYSALHLTVASLISFCQRPASTRRVLVYLYYRQASRTNLKNFFRSKVFSSKELRQIGGAALSQVLCSQGFTSIFFPWIGLHIRTIEVMQILESFMSMILIQFPKFTHTTLIYYTQSTILSW